MVKRKHISLSAAAGGVVAVASGVNVFADTAPARLMAGVYAPAEQLRLQKAQFIWGGRNYCFYNDAWNGPGFYWCGYAWRRGWGWGGPVGWHGWGRGYHGGRYYHRGGYYHGGGGHYGGYYGGHHGGGYHGGGYYHGGGGGGFQGGGGHGGGGHH